MKCRWLAVGLALVMTLAAGCGKTEETPEVLEEPADKVVNEVVNEAEDEKIDIEPQNYEAAYVPILDEYYKLIYYGTDGGEISGYTGVMELLTRGGFDEAARQIGYSMEDISGDGVPELMMSFIEDETEDGIFGKHLFAGYYLGKEGPQQLFDGWGRNGYSLMENGDILYQGSAGAAYSIFGTYDISKDGAELICNDYYFTHEQDEDYAELACYHNTTGEWDKDASEKMDMTLEEFWQLEEELMEQVSLVELQPFIDYVPKDVPVYEKLVYDAEAWVNVAYADEVVTEATNYDWFTADESPDCTKVIFMGEGNVQDFKFLSLFCDDVLEDGTPVYTVEELYRADRLGPEKSLVVEMTFWGTIPSYGYSFVDDNGETRRYALGISGMDGSIFTEEF